jgi:uncharacterized protein
MTILGILLFTALSTFAGLLLLPEHILYRQRALFSVLDMDESLTLRAFDQRAHDGHRLRSWYIPSDGERPTIVYFAGRDGDILRKPAHLFQLAEEGYGLLLAGYRGYGGNPGYPREADMYRDATSLLAQAGDAGLAPGGFVLYGYSMGSGIASNAAVQFRPRALILEAPMSNFLEAVQQQAGRVPSWLVRTRFDNRARVSELELPILLLAGGNDPVTPAWFALSLASANQRHARIHVVEDANHFNIIRLGGRQAIAEFMLQFEATDPLPAPGDPDIMLEEMREARLDRAMSEASPGAITLLIAQPR